MARGNIFKDPRRRKGMLNLRIRGYSYERIAKRYKVDHTTIIYHCQAAGITLPVGVRNKMYSLIKQGVPSTDIATKLAIPVDVIYRYVAIYGQSGNRVFSRRVIQNNPIPLGAKPVKIRKSKIKIQPIWWKMIKKLKPVMLRLPQYVSMRDEKPIESTLEPPVVTKTDERGVIWLADNKGGWTCLGMSEEARHIDEERKKMNSLRLKRIQMLSY